MKSKKEIVVDRSEKISDKKAKAVRIANALDARYGHLEPNLKNPDDPLEILVLTILSQNTNDVNRDRAMKSLKEKFHSWENVVGADRKKIEAAIRVGGLGRQKSERIKNVLKWVKKNFGEYSLKKLGEVPTGQAHEMLMEQKGIGPKTAAIVLLFGFGKPLFPVDTHIHRITMRLGLIPEGTSADRAHQLLGNLFPPKMFYSTHLNIINHGKTICKARKPFCSRCFLRPECAWPEKNAGKYE